MANLIERYREVIVGVLSCFDRVVIRGTLPVGLPRTSDRDAAPWPGYQAVWLQRSSSPNRWARRSARPLSSLDRACRRLGAEPHCNCAQLCQRSRGRPCEHGV